MLTSTLRKGTELSSSEKGDIIVNMFLPGTKEERNSMRESLAQKYGITEGTITSLIAHETMRRMRNGTGTRSGDINAAQTEGDGIDEKPTQSVQESTQTRVYAITTLFDLTEEIRGNILEEFGDVIRGSATDSVYDYYLDIEAISDYYNIDPSILEQFLRNRYNWLGVKLDELKNGRILNEEDKMNIRLYVSEGIDEKDKKAKRKEMAQKYGVSTYVIGAITAWKVDKGGGVVLKKNDMNNEPHVSIPLTDTGSQESYKRDEPNEIPSELDRNTADSDVSLVGHAIPSQSGEALFNGVLGHPEEATDGIDAVFSEEDVVFIQELAGSFDLNNDEQRELFLQDVFDLFPDYIITDVKRIIPDFPDDKAHIYAKRSGEGMGALINYNNEIKNKWRQKLKEFIDENTEKEKRKDMKVLCLPGVESLEIPLYLELGFKPENIIGVEAGIVQGKKDSEVIARFQVNAAQYGIQTRIGKLEKVLETEETVFDVVSLDFLGGYCRVCGEILSKIDISDNGILFINLQGKRDAHLRKHGHLDRLVSDAHRFLSQFEDFQIGYEGNHLHSMREGGALINELGAFIGGGVNLSGNFYKEIAQFLPSLELHPLTNVNPGLDDKILDQIYEVYFIVARTLSESSLKSHDDVKLINFTMEAMMRLLGGFLNKRHVQLGNTYKYFGDNKTPMISIGFNLSDKKKKETFKQFLPFMKFLVQLFKYREEIISGKVQIYVNKGSMKYSGNLFTSAEIQIKSGTLILGKVIIDKILESYVQFFRKYPCHSKSYHESKIFELID